MDPKDKVVVVTGATSGLGQAAAIDFAKAGARVYIVGRDAARAQETLTQVKAAGGQGEVILGDVSTREGVHAVAASILAKTSKVDVLLNNAGGTFKTQTQTADGVEMTFALNTLGAYLLEKELHGALVAAKGRVVNVATGLLNHFPLVPDELPAPKKFSGFNQYGRCKLASVMMTMEQSKRFAAEGVTALSVHPGIIMGTRFGGGQPSAVQTIFGPLMRGIGVACSLEEAVRRFRAACFNDLPSGSYVVEGVVGAVPKQAQDEQVRSQVIAVLERLAATPGASAA
jgi:NAD(P)-dependent dehydrogenase (short-subunit alcohol dehydrogenase family)